MIFKFLVQVEFAERTRWREGISPERFLHQLDCSADLVAKLATTGPDPRVTVTREELPATP